jgi:hypothetical protein
MAQQGKQKKILSNFVRYLVAKHSNEKKVQAFKAMPVKY